MKKTTKIIDYYGLIGIDNDLIPNNYNCSKGTILFHYNYLDKTITHLEILLGQIQEENKKENTKLLDLLGNGSVWLKIDFN